MSPDNISYTRSCRDGSAGLPKTELCGQVICLTHTRCALQSPSAHQMHCSKDEIYYYDFEREKNNIVFGVLIIHFDVFSYFFCLFFISYFLTQKINFWRTHCLCRIKSFLKLVRNINWIGLDHKCIIISNTFCRCLVGMYIIFKTS